MHSFEPLLLLDVRQTATTGLPEFAQACSTRMHLGDRLVTLFGRPDASGDVVLSAVLQPVSGELCVLRSRALSTASYPSLTTEHPAAQMFERELWEQTGITPVNHPWLKPVRYEGALQQTMAQHSFFKVRGPEVHEVGVGPIHAGVIEPGHFRFMCLGEQVHHLELQLGYQHRGLEPLLLRRSPLALAATVESICGDSCIANAWAYCASVEAMAEIPATTESNLTRAVALELERVAMHLATLAGLATDIAFLQGGASYGRLRTAIINATMRVCGSRFGRGWVRPGGVRFGLTDTLRADLTQTLTAFSMDIATVNTLMRKARSVQARVQGVGIVDAKTAKDLGLLGLVARASGIAVDTRTSLPGALHRQWPLVALSEPAGDCWARMQLRMREIDASVNWLIAVLGDAALELHARPQPMNQRLRPDLLCISLREGARGQVVHVLETSPQGDLLHYKVQDPSLQNWFGLALAMRDNAISDFPICNKSFDLSYCGNDL